jgi:hypothetical protein
MSIIKITSLQSFSISVLALAMVACGGSSDDSAPAATPTPTPTSLTTATDIAKAAAGIQAAKTTFDSVIAHNEGIFHEIMAETGAGTSSCGTSSSAGSTTVTTHSATANPTDGAIENHACLDGDEKFDGKLITTCNNASCDNALYTATNLVWGNTAQVIDLKANGTWVVAASDTFKGSSSITKSGASTTFTFSDGLVQTYPSKNTVTGSGVLTVSGANATNCVDGTYSYNVSTALTMPSGTQRLSGGAIKVSSGGTEAGTVTFNADGSIKVKLNSGAESTVTKAEFEGYCGLKEAYDFSEKINDASTL